MANVIVYRSNRLGIPLIAVQGRVVENNKTIFTFNNHVNLNDNFIGVFLVKFNEAVDAASTNPVVFRTIGATGSDVQAYYTDGDVLKETNLGSIAAPTYHEFLYDRVSNRLQLIR